MDTVWQISIIEDTPDAEVESYHNDTLSDGVRRLEAADRLVAHNQIGYDLVVLEKVLGVDLSQKDIVDTLVLSRLGNPERRNGHSLEAWGRTLGAPKVEHNEWDKWSPAMEKRCNVDVRINKMVWDRLKAMFDVMPVAVEIEHKVAVACRDMCATGIHFDVDGAYRLLDSLLIELEADRAMAESILPSKYKAKGKARKLKNVNRRHWGYGQLDPGSPFTEVELRKLQPGSRQDIATYLIDTYGWRPTQKTETGLPKVTEEILMGLPWEEAHVFANYFKTEKLIGQLNAEVNKAGNGGGWLHHVTEEGKLHANFIPLRAVTGRPACTAPNLQQVSTDGRARELFLPRPGWKLVGVDADGQELRCLGHYLFPYDGGAYAREVVQGDIHSTIQNLIGFFTRNGTKPVEYGLIYGAGNEKLGLIAVKDALSAGEEPPRNLKKRGKEIRQAILSGIKGFSDLLSGVKEKASRTEDGKPPKLRGVDGRTLWVRSAHSALNLLLQSCGIIHMKRAIADLRPALEAAGYEYDRDWAMVLWVHDEIQIECRPEIAEDIGRIAAGVIEEAARKLGIRTPMTGTYQIGNNWKETH